jgi:RimJ/RimL family protein N-acetyltransferase
MLTASRSIIPTVKNIATYQRTLNSDTAQRFTEIPPGWTQEKLLSDIAQNTDRIYIHENNDLCATLNHRHDFVGMLVMDTHAGRGLGAPILATAITHIRLTTDRPIQAGILTDNIPSLKVFIRNNFLPYAHEPDYLHRGKPTSRLLLRRTN